MGLFSLAKEEGVKLVARPLKDGITPFHRVTGWLDFGRMLKGVRKLVRGMTV